jgi:dipeptide/tripeptide permease
MFNFPDFPGIKEEALVGYTEDKRSKRAFVLPYYLIILPIFICSIAIVGYCVVRDSIGMGWWAAFFACGVSVFIALYHAMCATPRSLHSGRPMQRYRNSSKDSRVWEIIYIDEESRTYFRQLYVFYIQPDHRD